MVHSGRASEKISTLLSSMMEMENKGSRNTRERSTSAFDDIAQTLSQEIKTDPFLNSRLSSCTPKRAPISRILVVLGRIPTRHGQAVAQIFKYIKGISYFSDVLLVVTNEPSKTLAVNPDNRDETRISDEEYVISFLNRELPSENLSRVQIYSGSCWTERGIENTLHEIDNFAPDAALCFLGLLQSKIIRPILSMHMGVIEVQFNIGNDPSDECHIVLAHGRSPHFRDRVSPQRWRNHQIPIEVPERDSTHVVGIDADDYPDHIQRKPDTTLRLVTVLSLDRIQRVFKGRYKKPDFDMMDALFNKYPELDWVFIGVSDTDDFSSINEFLENRVRQDRIKLAGWIGNLRLLYNDSDVFVHLPYFSGGAMGMAIAIDEGIPAICGRKSDCANILREDHTFEYNGDFFMCLEQMLEDSAYRHTKAAEQKRALQQRHTVEAVGRDIMLFARQARHRFKQANKSPLQG